MIYRQIYKITDTQLLITVPEGFKNKRVLVVLNDETGDKNDKLTLMKLAASDPQYLADMKEVNDDFENIEHKIVGMKY